MKVTEANGVYGQVMEDKRIKMILPNLRQLCAEGEASLEMHSVRIILGGEDEGLDPGLGLFSPLYLCLIYCF